jgi:hypothetical protein
MLRVGLALAIVLAACSGQKGDLGPMGDPGATGRMGAMGSMGDPGGMGASVLVVSESAGANCAAGGVKIVAVNGTAYVCNGANGQGVTVTSEAAGANCAGGGIKVQNGASTTYVCNGVVDYTKAIANGTTPQTASFNITGNGTLGGSLSASTLDVTTFDTCPANYFTVSLAHSTLCVQWIPLTAPAVLYVDALDQCNALGGARLCTYQQLRRYCLVSPETPSKLTVNSWLGDRAGDSIADWVNAADCNDFDATASSAATSVTGAYCCLEWMKYH